MANRTTVRPTCAPPAHASVGSNETSEARGDGWAWTLQPPSRANTCILASAHGTPSSTRTSKRGEASRRSSAGRLMKACRSATATVPSHASALSRPPTTGMRSYSARAAPGRMHGGRDHEASHRAHHQPHELAAHGSAASGRGLRQNQAKNAPVRLQLLARPRPTAALHSLSRLRSSAWQLPHAPPG